MAGRTEKETRSDSGHRREQRDDHHETCATPNNEAPHLGWPPSRNGISEP